MIRKHEIRCWRVRVHIVSQVHAVSQWIVIEAAGGSVGAGD